LGVLSGVLPEVTGDFKVGLAAECPVGLILLNGLNGKEPPRPQAIFAGESSRGFVLPPLLEKKSTLAAEHSKSGATGAVKVLLLGLFLGAAGLGLFKLLRRPQAPPSPRE
jgi:hypothetical protein